MIAFSSQAPTLPGREAAIQAAMDQIARQFGTASIHDTHKRSARRVLRALESGAAYPSGFTDLIWSLPQDVDAALHQVRVRHHVEKGVIRRYQAYPDARWYLKPNPLLVARLHELMIALRWLRRHEEQAWREAAQ